MDTVKVRPESPLANWIISQPERRQDRLVGVVFEELGLQTHVNLRCEPSHESMQKAVAEVLGVMLPTQPNTFVQKYAFRVFWLASDEWLIVAPPTEYGLAQRLDSALEGKHHAVTDLGGGQTIIRISGSAARGLLAQGCTLDLHPTVFGMNRSAQTLLAHIPVLVCLVSGTSPEEAIFDVVVRRSFADYLAHWLVDGAAEIGFKCYFPNDIEPEVSDVSSKFGSR